MIESPNLLLYLTPTLIPTAIGLVIFAKWPSVVGFSAAVGGLVVFIILTTVWVSPIMDEYDRQVMELIETTDCKTISKLADDYPLYKTDVVDEVILRCINDNPHLQEFIMENKQ